MTTAQGIPMSDDQNSLRVGIRRGAALMEDFAFREKLFHFDHERIPGAWCTRAASVPKGYLECLEAIPELTMASPFKRRAPRPNLRPLLHRRRQPGLG